MDTEKGAQIRPNSLDILSLITEVRNYLCLRNVQGKRPAPSPEQCVDLVDRTDTTCVFAWDLLQDGQNSDLDRVYRCTI